MDGVILPFLTVEIGAPTTGLLEAVLLERGDTVTKGQPIARLQASVERESAELARLRAESSSELAIAEVKRDSAKAKYEKRRVLIADGIVTTEELDDAKAELALAELKVLGAKESATIEAVEYRKAAAIRDRAELLSPIDGVVIDRHRETGELVTSSLDSSIYTIAQLNPLLVEVRAPVWWLGTVIPGDKAIVRTSFDTSLELVATVRVLDRVADAASETVRVQLELPNADGSLPAGIRCKVELQD